MSGRRAVSAEFWEQVCPKESRHIISSKGAPSLDVEGDVIVDWWADKLRDVKEKCVEVESSEQVIFDRL